MKRPTDPLKTNAILKVIQKARRLSMNMAELSSCTDKELEDLVNYFTDSIRQKQIGMSMVQDEQLRRHNLP